MLLESLVYLPLFGCFESLYSWRHQEVKVLLNCNFILMPKQTPDIRCAVLLCCCVAVSIFDGKAPAPTPHLRRKKTTFVFLSVSIITKLKTFISFSDKCYQKMTPFLIQWLMAVKSRLAPVNVISNFCFKIGISVSCLFSKIHSWH